MKDGRVRRTCKTVSAETPPKKRLLEISLLLHSTIMEQLFVPVFRAEMRSQYLRLASNAHVAVAINAQESSSVSYCAGVRALFKWASLCDVDPCWL
jgi:hypothetical protein